LGRPESLLLLQVNILITPSHRACLADFGLSTAGESQVLQQSSSSNAHATGTLRWEAPELLAPETDGNAILAVNTRASDIYSFACVCYEVKCLCNMASMF
jgi:serine/threonine protein kinase